MPTQFGEVLLSVTTRLVEAEKLIARIRKVAAACRGKPALLQTLDLAGTSTDFQIARRGEDPRFAHGPLRVPAGILRDRPADILTPEALAKRHGTYRCRVLMGPTYRADMWALLDRAPSLSASDLARQAYGSFATAW